MWRHKKVYENLLHRIPHLSDGVGEQIFFAKKTVPHSHNRAPTAKCIVFDMDGTLNVPVLDFDRMRRETGLLEGDILVELEKLDEEDRKRCEAIIESIEEEAHQHTQLQPGVLELFDWLRRSTTLRLGLVTRNTRKGTDRKSVV